MTEVVGHFLIFTVAAIGFLIAPLLIGRLVVHHFRRGSRVLLPLGDSLRDSDATF